MARSSYNRRRKMFWCYVSALLILSFSFFGIAINSALSGVSFVLNLISGIMFWVGLFGVAGVSIHINKSRKASPYFEELYPNVKRLGLTHFFQNKYATVADTAVFAVLAAFVCVKVFTDSITLQLALIALFVFSFGMHCMLNGINYVYINYKGRRV